MKCPFCNTEMLHGYLNVRNTVWSERKHDFRTNTYGAEKYALALGLPMLTAHHVESDCCPSCKRIIIDSSDYDNNL